MTKDTYLSIVRKTLQGDPEIKIYESHVSKLADLGRQVERRECTPQETIPKIEALFTPFGSRDLWKALEKALR